MHKPWHSLIFAITVFLLLGAAGLFFPSEGLVVSEQLVLKFPSPHSLFEDQEEKADISSVLDALNKMDTTFRIDEPEEAIDTAVHLKQQIPAEPAPPPNLNMQIQYSDEKALQKFYRALESLKDSDSSIRVLHYGDSQIEGDRITDYLRLKLQGQFGGSGPGLISLMPLTSRASTKIFNSPGWDRYTTFTAPDIRVKHRFYGVRASFCRYAPYESSGDSGMVHSASVQIVSAPSSKSYTKLMLYYGGAEKRTWCEFYDGPALVAADSLKRGGHFNIAEYDVDRGSATHELRFRGTDSPDFYALSLEGEKGVMVDNIAMRGSSGTFFHRVDHKQMRQFYDHLNVKLVILQFGGNTLPALRDTAMAAGYAGYVRRQIAIVKKLAPGASILFIGPSDMSVKKGTDYVTYDLLEPLRDFLKKEVLDAGCAFFDLYDVMGGRNSMPSWVDEKLAGKDYTHFSPRGARKIATLFYGALINDYNTYIRSRK